MDVLHETSFEEEDQEREALLALLLAEDGFTPTEVQTIQARKETGPVPLSFAQERLWFLDQLIPGLSSYNIPVTLRLNGPLQIDVLARSLNEIVRRHSALRTSFKMMNDQPVQVIAETLDVTPEVVDLRSLLSEEKLAQALYLTKQEARQPFDLANGPLFRTRLLWMEEQEFRLLLTMHHIVSDGWSMSLLYRELSVLYSAFSQGKPSPLPETAIQYADFAVWQHSWLQGEILEEHLSYWREQLKDSPTVLNLPTDHPRPAIQTYSGEVEGCVLSPPLTTALKNMSQRAESTLFMTLLAAWQTLLWRYSSQDDICVGTFIANRNRPEIEELIGFFINNLALRTDLSGHPTFWELLKRVRKVTLDAYAHQDIPFEKLLQELGWKHDLSVTPLFQVMLILQNMPEPIPELAGLSIQETGEWSKRAHFDLALWVTEAQDHLELGLQYNTDLFDAQTIQRMLSHFHVLLEGIVADPQQRLANLPLFSEQERQHMLQLSQTGLSESPIEHCLHDLFEEQVQQTPDTIALVFEQEQLTYAALNRRANQLAHYLRKLGIGPETRVGLCLPRCCEQIIGLLGILKAGGAYVPLDPAYPADRLAFMAKDAQLNVLITLSSLREQVPTSFTQIVCLDTESYLLDLEPVSNPANGTHPTNLAYVIYTSGSTGKPRGVALQHCSVVNFLVAVRDIYAPVPGDRLLQFTSISFDISVEEIFAALTSGVSLVLRSEAMLSSIHFFLDQCAQWGITIMDLPTAFWHEIVAELEGVNGGLPEALRLVIIGGERAQPEKLAIWQRHTSPHRLLINTYGPTEATVVSTSHVIDHSQKPEHEIPIGRPLTNVQIVILDRFQQVVPIGVWGELAIGGKGVARGYLGLPELTAEKFSPDPSGNGTRLYRSGDRARYLPDGTIEFGGRLDDQVKLRGFRVEPGEIEAALRLHPAIHNSVVLPFESSFGEKVLVAYLVWKNGNALEIDELRAFLQTLLPGYMIPTTFLSLKQLPMQPNGKIDRRALPTPDLATLEQPRKHLVAPRDALEWQLAQIWEECLQMHPIGVTENFFELGGHSLLAVRLLSRIQTHFSRNLPLSALFQGATIEQLAALLRQEPGTSASVLVEMQPRGNNPPLFLMHPTGGNVLCYAALTRSLGEGQPVYALQARGLQAEETPLTDVREMARLYIQAICARQPDGPYLLGGWSSGGLLALEVAQQLQAQRQKVALLVLLDTPALWQQEPESRESARSTTVQDDAAVLARFVSQLGDHNQDLGSIYADLRQLSSEGQLLFVLKRAKEEGLVPVDANLSLIDRLIQVYKADVQATLHYHPQMYPGRITYVQSEHSAQRAGDTLKSWQKIAGERLDLFVSPGDHFGMLREPHVQVLATQLQVSITRALEHLS